MGVTCDKCSISIDLDEAQEFKSEVLCSGCYEDAEEFDDKTSPHAKATCNRCRVAIGEGEPAPHRRVGCPRCKREVRTCSMFSKNEGSICIYCAHELELSLYKGEHDKTSCSICLAAAMTMEIFPPSNFSTQTNTAEVTQ